MQQHNGIGHKGPQLVSRRPVSGVDLGKRKGLRPKGLQNLVVLLDLRTQQRLEAIRVDQIDHPQTRPGRFIAIGRSDAAFGRPDFVFALEDFPLLVQLPMIGQNQVGRFADKQMFDPHSELFQIIDFRHQTHRIHHHAIADDARLAAAQDAGRNEVQDISFPADINRVPGVVAALGADNDLGLVGQDIDDFSLALVAPLGAD